MLFATIAQGSLFIWMMASGALIGLWYLLIALLRRFIRAGFWLTLACDLLFGVGAAVIFCAALVMGNYGQPHPFAILATLCGAILPLAALSPPLKALQSVLLRAARKIMTYVSENRLIKVILK